jgi:Xaa-Pro dipeptidase
MAVFTRGVHTLTISMELHALNRKRLVENLSSVESLKDSCSIVLLEGGSSTTRHCSDHEPLFRQESYFHWAFGVEEPDFLGGVNVNTGKSVLFPPRLPEEYAVWMGHICTKEEIKERYGVDEVVWREDIKDFLKSHGNVTLLTLKGLNSDSGKMSKEAHFDGIEMFTVDSDILHPIITELRVFKTDLELEVLRYASKISSQAHIQVMQRCRSGMKEYQLESIFQHHCYYQGEFHLTCVYTIHFIKYYSLFVEKRSSLLIL